jgi:hypothetical protein
MFHRNNWNDQRLLDTCLELVEGEGEKHRSGQSFDELIFAITMPAAEKSNHAQSYKHKDQNFNVGGYGRGEGAFLNYAVPFCEPELHQLEEYQIPLVN